MKFITASRCSQSGMVFCQKALDLSKAFKFLEKKFPTYWVLKSAGNLSLIIHFKIEKRDLAINGLFYE